MRIRFFPVILLIFALVAGLAGCGASESPLPFGTLPGVQDSGAAAPETTAAPAAAVPAVKGADSVKTLLEKSLDYFHSGCDYEKIADVHDQQAYLAWFLMEDLCRNEKLTLAQAMEKAVPLFGDAETLQAQDPALAEALMEEMDAEDPEEYLSEYMGELRDAMRNGEIPKDHPEYERLSAMLADWDKGADYVFEHYPEILEDAEQRYIALGLDGALKLLRKFARFEDYNRDLNRFRDLECEYSPENTDVNPNGICSYDMGSVVSGNEVWSIGMMYRVEDGVYYLIGYSVVLGSMGG